MDSDLDEIRNRVDIVELISEYIPLKKSGQNFKGLCPFHSEKTPSFMVHPNKQIFHCFGCGAGGDIFGFMMKKEALEFRDALELLAKKAGVTLKKRSAGEEGKMQSLKAVQKEALIFFKRCLSQSKQALDYLEKRGLNKTAIEDFSLGYSPAGWHEILGRLKAKGFNEQLVSQSGLVASGSKGLYDIFRSRIVFPIFDIHGDVIAFGGRSMGEEMPKYLNSPETPLFRKGENLYAFNMAKDAIRTEGFAIIVEGYMDAIMCHQWGIGNAVAPLGTALTSGQLKKLARLSDDVLLLFDGDQAGIQAARRSLPLIFEQGIKARVLLLPEGEDPDSLLKKNGPEYLRDMMAHADTPIGFLLKDKVKGKTNAVSEAVEMISKAGDPIVRDELVLELSERTKLGERSIRERLARYTKTGMHMLAKSKVRPYNEEELLLSAALSAIEKVKDIFKNGFLDDIRDPLVKGLLAKLVVEGINAGSIMGPDGEEAERTLLTKLSINPGFDTEDIDMVIEDCKNRLAKRRIDLAGQGQLEEIKSAETAGDGERLRCLLSERQTLLRRKG